MHTNRWYALVVTFVWFLVIVAIAVTLRTYGSSDTTTLTITAIIAFLTGLFIAPIWGDKE